jgi:phosphoglycolate phosphatase
MEKTCPFAGVPELLDALRDLNVGLAVLSNKPDEHTKLLVSRLLPGWRFGAVEGATASGPKKPDPAVALDIAGRLGVRPEKCLFVGDSDVDMKTAAAAGMYGIGALWGFRSADELLAGGARALIGKPADLLELI